MKAFRTRKFGTISGRAWRRQAKGIAEDNKEIGEMNTLLVKDMGEIHALASKPMRFWKRKGTLAAIASIAGEYVGEKAPRAEKEETAKENDDGRTRNSDGPS